MLRLSKELYSRPILSLRSGTPIGVASEPILDPNNLKVIGWWCKPQGGNDTEVLLIDDVRDVIENGIVIDDLSALSKADDLLRHKEVLELGFSLPGKAVRTERKKIGKVEDFAFNEGFFVQKLYVGQPLIKALTADTHIIDREQIIEITDSYILVKDTEIPAGRRSRVRQTLQKNIMPAAGASTTDSQ